VTDSPSLRLVRSIFVAWGKGDFSNTEWADPEIEYVIADGPAPGTWRGLVAMQKASRDWVSAWEDWRVEAEDYRMLDNERLLVLMRYGGRGKTSGVELGEMHSRAVSVWHIRAGKVARIACWWDRDRGLAALGLTLESDAP
jgi:ketosteroid isomerase-like protein